MLPMTLTVWSAVEAPTTSPANVGAETQQLMGGMRRTCAPTTVPRMVRQPGVPAHQMLAVTTLEARAVTPAVRTGLRCLLNASRGSRHSALRAPSSLSSTCARRATGPSLLTPRYAD